MDRSPRTATFHKSNMFPGGFILQLEKEGDRRLIGRGSLGHGQVIRKLKQNGIIFAPYLMLRVDFESPVKGGV